MANKREKLIIDLDMLPSKIKIPISRIETSPHSRWIRYLLTKRYCPTAIRAELNRIGLSAPSIPVAKMYFEFIIWAAAEKFNVTKVYENYRSLLKNSEGSGRGKSRAFAKNILNFKMELGDDAEMQANFMRFIYYLDLEWIWGSEIHKFYGTISNYPVDEDGDRIFNSYTTKCKSVDAIVNRIIQNPKRYLIDKMLLEEVPVRQITERARKLMGIGLHEYEISTYKKAFFNIESRSIEDKIHMLEMEKKYFEQVSKDVSKGTQEYRSDSIGERNLLKHNADRRIQEIDKNLFDLNVRYHHAVASMMTSEKQDYGEMLDTMSRTIYKKFSDLSTSGDRNVVAPLTTLSKTFCLLADKAETLKGNKRASSLSDKHTNETILELYKQTVEDMQGEDGPMASDENFGGSYEDISGIEELGVSYSDDDDDDDNVDIDENEIYDGDFDEKDDL